MQLVAFVAFEKEQQQKNAQSEHEESTDKVQRQHPHETQLQKNSEAASTLLTIVSLLGAGLHSSSRTLSLQLPVEKTQLGSHLTSMLFLGNWACLTRSAALRQNAQASTLITAPVAIGDDEYSQFSDRLAR